MALAVCAACQPGGELASPVEVGAASERLAPLDLSVARLGAIEAWRREPTDARALTVAEAYFPEYASAPAAAWRDFGAGMAVKLPSRAGEALELESLGQTFRVVPRNGAPMPLAAPVGGWKLAGGQKHAQRLEQYAVVESGGRFETRFTVELPPRVKRVRETANGYLEFHTAEAPVLRLHTPELRDAKGLSRTAAISLEGLVPVSGGEAGWYDAPAGKVEVSFAFDLQGLEGPVVVDPGWSATVVMGSARYRLQAVLLGSGKVLAVGGNDLAVGFSGQNTAELFDPATSTWTATPSVGASFAGGHAAVLLPSGKVLVSGGYTSAATSQTASALYDPAGGTTGSWTAGPNMKERRFGHTLTLSGGRVFVIGGSDVNSYCCPGQAEIYDPALNTFVYSGSCTSCVGTSYSVRSSSDMRFPRYYHTTTPLPSGKLLVAGGKAFATSTSVSDVEVFNAPGLTTRNFSNPTFSLQFHDSAVSTVLPSGEPFVVGSKQSFCSPSPCPYPNAVGESYSESSVWWTATPVMNASRWFPGGGMIAGSQFLAVGGESTVDGAGGVYLNSTEVYRPAQGAWSSFRPLNVARYGMAMVVFANGGVLVTGGSTGPGATASTELLDEPSLHPVATAQSPTTAEDTAKPLTLSFTELFGTARYTVLTQPAHGTVTALNLSPSGAVTYTPTPDYAGADSFTFLVNDYALDSVAATVSLTVTPVNDPPVMAALGATSLAEDTPGTVALLGVGPGGGADEATQVVTVTGTSSNTTIVSNAVVTGTGASRSLAFTPVLNAVGPVTVTVTEKDNGGVANNGVDTSTQTFTLTVNPVNDAPIFDAVADTSCLEDTTPVVNVAHVGAGGGPDELPQAVTVTATSGDPTIVSNAAVAFATDAGRTLTFTQVPDAVGPVTVTVTAKDNGGVASGGVDTTSKTFVLTMTPVNDPPTFSMDASVTILEDTPTPITVTGVGPGGGADEAVQDVTLVATSPTPVVIPDGVVTGTGATRTILLSPQKDVIGKVTMTATASDDGGLAYGGIDTTSKDFVLTIAPVNDPPVIDRQLDGGLPTSRTTPLSPGTMSIDLTGIGPGGGPDEHQQTVTVAATADNPALAPDLNVLTSLTDTTRKLQYTPPTGVAGVLTITVTLTDTGGVANGGQNTTVTSMRHTILATQDHPPTVTDLSKDSLKDAPVTFTLTGTDIDNDPLTFAILTPPAHGTISGTLPQVTYTPTARYAGVDTFTYQATDPAGLTSNVGTVTFNVTANQAPTAKSASYASPNGDPVLITLEGNDTDSTTPLTFTVVTSPSGGALTGTPPALTYTPNGDFAGKDTFTFTASDGDLSSAPATIQINVTRSTNHAPVAQPGTATSVDGATVPIALQAGDLDSDPLTYTITAPPQHGQLEGTAPQLSYRPEADFAGTDTFTWVVNDGHVDSAPALFSIEVVRSPGSLKPRPQYGYGCNCDATGGASFAFLGVGVLLRLARRRPRA